MRRPANTGGVSYSENQRGYRVYRDLPDLPDIEHMGSGSADPVAVGIVGMSVMPLGEGMFICRTRLNNL